MVAGDRYATWEALAIHMATGLLFVFISALLLVFTGSREPWALLLVVPVTALAAWGWWFQARFFASLLRGRDLDVLG